MTNRYLLGGTQTPSVAGTQAATEVATIAELKALAAPTDQIQVNTLGYYAAGDGGGGSFWWDASSSATVDNGLVFAADAGGTGRWKRVDSEFLTPEMFGAKGDGTTDDYAALLAAKTAGPVQLNDKTYLIGTELKLTGSQSIIGKGANSILYNSGTTVNVLALTGQRNVIDKLTLKGGKQGLTLRGEDGVCTFNSIGTVICQDNQTGVYLDGYNDTAKPCYWNYFQSVTVHDCYIKGIDFVKTGAGDSPNNNFFDEVVIRSTRTSCTHGLHMQSGKYQNVFSKTNITLTSSASYLVRVGSGVDRTIFGELYTETSGAVANVTLDAGSTNTILMNLYAASAGSAIVDNSGGSYRTFNAGFPITDYLGAAVIQSVRAGKMLFDYDGAATTPATSTFYEHRYINAVPASGSYNRGSVVWNTNVGVSNGPTGWICTTGGTPGTWAAFGERYLEGTVTWDPGNIANGASETKNVTVTGAELYDLVNVSFGASLQGLTLTGYVSVSGTVTAVLANSTGGAIDLGSSTLVARVRKL